MNIKKDSYFIAFISILILNMLLIFFGVFSQFFNVRDYTLIAGIIAFVGAIIGGSITLAGVNKTIFENRRVERIVKIKEDLINLKICEKLLKDIEEHYYNVDFKNIYWEFPGGHLINIISNENFNISLSLIDEEIFNTLSETQSILEEISGIIYIWKELENEVEDRFKVNIKDLHEKFEKLLISTKKGIQLIEEKQEQLKNGFIFK